MRERTRLTTIDRLIMRRLGGSRHRLPGGSQGLPFRLSRKRSVAVIGSGIAGLSASAVLADRGFSVTLFERDATIGGKTGSRPIRFPDGFVAQVDHGFHGFFPQYHNLLRMLERFGADRYLRRIADHLILGQDGSSYSFKDLRSTPGLNIVDLARQGVYRLADVARTPKSWRLAALLAYDGEKTFRRYDHLPFARFSATADLRGSLPQLLSTLSRFFFADPELMSTAELIKSFHFYFLGNDLGLLFSYLTGSYEQTLLAPARRYLEEREVRLLTSTPVERLGRAGTQIVVEGGGFDYAILAADSSAARRIVDASAFLSEDDPETLRRLRSLDPPQGYAVLRVWLDRDARADLLPFVATERRRMLDAVALCHRVDPACARWADASGGGVYELHCYSLPLDLRDEADARARLIEDLHHVLPELKGARVLYEHAQVRHDFSSFRVGLHESRPETRTGVPNLLLAGDWVRLRVPAMLMEAACTSALCAANEILAREGIASEPVWSVAERGLMAL